MVSVCTAKVNYVLKLLIDTMVQSYVLNRSYCQACGKTTVPSEILYSTIWNYWMLEPFREGSSIACFCVYLLTVETSAEVFRGSLKKKAFLIAHLVIMLLEFNKTTKSTVLKSRCLNYNFLFFIKYKWIHSYVEHVYQMCTINTPTTYPKIISLTMVP